MISFKDSLDLCFIQEHWLIKSHLRLHDLSSDFLSVSVSSIDDFSLLVGRPFGGSAILYRKSLPLSVTQLQTCSDRFCALKMQDLSGPTSLFISVYMPSQGAPSAQCEYLNTLDEIEGFINSQQYDNIILVGDFNVDFDRGGSLADFITDLNVVACDLSHRNSIGFTYERDDGIVRSWIDHIICSQSLCPNVHTSINPVLTSLIIFHSFST